MSKSLRAVFFGAFIAASCAVSSIASADTKTDQVEIPRGVVIPVKLTKDQRVGGFGDAREEKKMRAEVAEDVIVGGHVIAMTGDLVEGHFTTEKNVTKRAFSSNTSQELALDVDDVVNFCGDTIHMKFERTFVGGGRAGFLSFGAHAHDAVFEKGMLLKASTDRLEKSICGAKTDRSPSQLPPDLLVPDEEVSPAPNN